MKVCVVFVLAFQAHVIAATGLTDRIGEAAGWLFGQRGEDSAWGEQTPRAVVALALAEDAYSLSPDEWRMMGKQVNIQLSLELAKPNGLTQLGMTRTALYMNALLATCQDPTRFHGLDLARDLRARLNARINSSAALPAAYLALCLAGHAEPNDVRLLQEAYAMHDARPDLRAIAVQAMACVKLQDPSVAGGVDGYVDSFSSWFPTVTGIVDVYTRALGYQALNAAGRGVADVEPLLRHQTRNGSFGSLLATYYAIPALQNSSLLALKRRRCQFDRMSEDKMLVGSTVPKVFFSLWMGEGQERETHSLTLPIEAANETFFDLMSVASHRTNPVFRFSWENSAVGKKVYSVAGRPNDVEREIYWTLYRTKGSPNGLDPKLLNRKDLVNTGVDRVRPRAGDHFVFWFRRKPQQH